MPVGDRGCMCRLAGLNTTVAAPRGCYCGRGAPSSGAWQATQGGGGVTADAHFTLTPAEVRTAHRCARVMVQFHNRAGKPVSAEIAALYQRFDNELHSLLARPRQGNDENNDDSEQFKVIGTARAAELTGWSKRTVHRRHTELGGWKADSIIGYLFEEHKVIQFIEAKNGR
jgi:hypothetical protein